MPLIIDWGAGPGVGGYLPGTVFDWAGAGAAGGGVAPAGDLIGAVQAYFDASDDLAEAFGQTITEAPSGLTFGYKRVRDQVLGKVDYPYVVFTNIGGPAAEYDTPDDDDGLTPYSETIEIQASVYATTEASARQLGALLASVLKDAPLEWDGGEAIYFRRMNASGGPTQDPERTKNGQYAWAQVVRFRAVVSGAA